MVMFQDYSEPLMTLILPREVHKAYQKLIAVSCYQVKLNRILSLENFKANEYRKRNVHLIRLLCTRP